MGLLVTTLFILIVTTFFVTVNFKGIVSFLHKINKKILMIVVSMVSIGIIITNFKSTVEFRETTPSWEYYHDPFWFTFLVHSNTITHLFVGVALSLLVTLIIMKIYEYLRKFYHQQG